MTGLTRVKAELMIYAIENDYFGYGSMINKMANGKYKVIVDGETYENTLYQLADEWDQLDELDMKDIVENYFNDVLLVKR